MSTPLCPDADFIALLKQHGCAETARRLGMNERVVHTRRTRLEKRHGIQIPVPSVRNTRIAGEHSARINYEVQNGVVLIGSDAHIWPGPMTTAMRAFVHFCKEFNPSVAIMNGDVMDFPQISRHPPIGWEDHPTVADEIEAAQAQLSQIEDAIPKRCKLAWTLGNHDSRLETRLATVAPEYARMHGFHLKDHFPMWPACWSVWLNDSVVVKHRWKGGQGATRANALNSGKSMVTGHLHSSKVTPLTDYGGTRYGVDTGCLADPNHAAFVDYTEDSPKDWRSGFAVLTFHKGVLMLPELVQVWDAHHVQFRGKIVRV